MFRWNSVRHAGTWPEVVRDTLLGAVATKLVQPGDEIVSIYHRRLEHGYPTPRCVCVAVTGLHMRDGFDSHVPPPPGARLPQCPALPALCCCHP